MQISSKAGFQRDNVPLAQGMGAGSAHNQSVGDTSLHTGDCAVCGTFSAADCQNPAERIRRQRQDHLRRDAAVYFHRDHLTRLHDMLAVFIVNAVNHGLRDLPCSIISQQPAGSQPPPGDRAAPERSAQAAIPASSAKTPAAGNTGRGTSLHRFA